MARINGDKMSGKLGDRIYSSWHGRPYTKSRPAEVANPRTDAQQRHRNAFAEISRLSSHLKEAHLVGLHQTAVRMQLNTYSVFKKINKDRFGADGIDYSAIEVSRGPVKTVHVTAVQRGADGMPTLAFDSLGTGGAATDMLLVFAYNPRERTCLPAGAAARAEGTALLELPPEWLGATVHLYAFLRDRRGRTSNTIHIQLPE